MQKSNRGKLAPLFEIKRTIQKLIMLHRKGIAGIGVGISW